MDTARRKVEKRSMQEDEASQACYSDSKTTTGTTTTNRNSSILSTLTSILVVLSTGLIVFAEARYIIPWHFQRFWRASGEFWQVMWDRILDTVGEDPVTLWVYGPLFIFTFVYWFVGVIYTLLDIYNKPDAIMRYKIQPGMNEPVDSKQLLKVIGMVLVNQFLVTPIVAIVSLKVMEWRGYPSFRELPTFHWVLFELAVLMLVYEIGFYYCHRLLHNKYLYNFIHKKHHEWAAPIAVAAAYAHPIEHVFSNIVPHFLGIFIMGSHVATSYIWYSLSVVETLHTHSGYHLPFLPSPEFHDYHHLKFNQNFGVLGMLDRLHGTDTKFRNTTSFKRHVMMFTLVPPREMYPDPSPKHQIAKE